MNFVQHLKAGSVAEATNNFASGKNNDQLLDHYLRVELCPCCGAPAADAKRRVASSPPAETLTADRHGAFVSGYTHARVFFTYFECSKCSALFCPTYYR
jgi:hypothetical protein